MANKSLNWKGKIVNGVWKVLEATDQRTKANSIVYKCENVQTGKIYYKSSAYLKQFKKRGSKKLTRGKERKWLKIPISDITHGNLLSLVKGYAKDLGIPLDNSAKNSNQVKINNGEKNEK